MQLTNHTVFQFACTLGFARDGREVAIVIAKASYGFDSGGDEAWVSDTQAPLVKGDEFMGAPGSSALLYETDFAHFKPNCDVLLNGSAHAPAGTLARWAPVGLQVGPVSKSFKVFGDRTWEAGLLSTQPSAPLPFSTLPISYGCAFGGVDDFGDDDSQAACYLTNPVGRGYHRRTARDLVDGTPLSNTEQIDEPVKRPDGNYLPMAFGAMGRNFASRVRHVGTYDEDWLATKSPYWPDDFRYEYFQAAPPEQRMPYPKGGEAVILRNLTPDGTTRFALPALDLAVMARFSKGTEKIFPMAVDTILIEPDRGQFSLTCRVGIPMSRSIFDVRELVLDKAELLKTRQFRNGKPHFLSPDDYARSKRRGGASA